MASDSKLSSFSQFFDFAWTKSNILSPSDVTECIGNEGLTKADSEEILDQCLLQALLTVRHFYDDIFRNSIDNDEIKYLKPGEVTCNYITRMCNDERWFGRPTIFERCFETISFVLACAEYNEKALSDIKRNAYISWSNYFEKYAEEFYNEGGWKKLRRIADSYAKVHDLICIVNPAQDSLDFINLYKSVENYMYFRMIRKTTIEKENETKIINRKIQYKTRTSLWIKFIVQNGNAESFAASWPKSPSEVTCLLRALRYYCNPYAFKAKHSKRCSDPRVQNKPISAATCFPERNPESCTKKENDRKREPHSSNSHKNSIFNEATDQESSNSSIKNVSLHNTGVEKRYVLKDTKIENFTGDGTDRTDIAAYTSSTPGEMWKKSGLQVYESLELGKKMKQAPSNSSKSFPLQNTAIEKDYKNKGKKNFKGSENNRTDNLPYSSSTAGERWKKVQRKRNWKKNELQLFNESLDIAEEMKQAPSNSSKSFPLQNTSIEKDCKDLGKKNIKGSKNDRTDNVPYSLTIDKMWEKVQQKRNWKKDGFQVSNKSLYFGEEMEGASSNSTISSVLQNTVIEKEQKDRDKENFTRRQNDRVNVPYTLSMANEMWKKPDKPKWNKKKVGVRDFENLELDKATRQASSIIHTVPPPNSEVVKDHSGKKTFTGDENEGTNNLNYMTGKMWRKTKGKKNWKEAGLQVFDQSLKVGEATRQEPSNSIDNNVPRQKHWSWERKWHG